MQEATTTSPAGVPPRAHRWRLVLLAMAIRVFALVLLQSWSVDPANNHWAAGWETGRIADHLARGEGFALEAGLNWSELGPTAWLAPLYPALLGALFSIFGSFSALSLVLVIVFQIVCDAGTCLVLAGIGRKLGRQRAGLLAGLIFALSPAAISISTRVIWCTSLLTFLCALLVARFMGHLLPGVRWRSSVVTGVLIGVCLLTSPTPALFIGAAGVYLIAVRRGPGLRSVATMALVALAVITPWVVRNHGALGSWFFIKSNSGNELFIGNNPLADGTYIRVYDTAREVLGAEELAELAVLGEVERAETLGRHALAWIRTHPDQFLELSGRRVWMYWTSPFLTDWGQLPLGPLGPLAAAVYALGQWALLVGAVLGLCALVRRRDGLRGGGGSFCSSFSPTPWRTT